MIVALLGTGLIGGSIGLALKRDPEGPTVVAFDRDEAAAARAVELGAADRRATSAAEAVADADIIFVATPVGAIADVVRSVADAVRPDAVITDVGSTKSRLVLDVEGSLPTTASFIGGHPMAGTEEEGIDAATAELFEGSWWILTPTDRSDPEAYRTLHRLLTTLGARVMALEPDAHDELMAVISHVPQLTATALMNMAAERGEEHAGLLALAAGGFRDVTRIAASNPEIWLDVCRENRDAIVTALTRFADRLSGIRDLVKRGSEDELRDELLKARTARRSLTGKAVEGDLFEVRLPVPDRPGVLAAVTTTVGNLGINIEDLQITHATEGGRGVLRVAVVGEDDAARIAGALNAQGFDAKAVAL